MFVCRDLLRGLLAMRSSCKSVVYMRHKYFVTTSNFQKVCKYVLSWCAQCFIAMYTISGLLLRLFSYWYDMDVIEEEAFLKWKEDLSQQYPGKGQALFQVSLVLLSNALYCIMFAISKTMHPSHRYINTTQENTRIRSKFILVCCEQCQNLHG